MHYAKKFSAVLALAALLGTAVSTPVVAGPTAKKQAYSEDAFLRAFSGKSRKVISDSLGQPAKKEQSVRPSNASSVIGKKIEVDSSKPVNVEMWYYNNIVEYSPKKTYKLTELTFVNDRCMNIAFFNNK